LDTQTGLLQCGKLVEDAAAMVSDDASSGRTSNEGGF
jgi:hypothetical protein